LWKNEKDKGNPLRALIEIFPPLQGEGKGGDGVIGHTNDREPRNCNSIPFPASPLKGEELMERGNNF
jgi:hypothetical protein